MNQIYRKSPFWSLAGPMFGYLAIQFAVQFAAQLVIEMPYAMRAYAEILRGSGDTVPSMQELLNSYMQTLEPAFEAIVRYQVEIATLSALGTIVLTGILFARDRKLEQKAGVILPERAPLSKYWTVVIFGIAGCIAATCLMAMVQLAFYDEQYQQTAQITYSAGLLVQIIGLGIFCIKDSASGRDFGIRLSGHRCFFLLCTRIQRRWSIHSCWECCCRICMKSLDLSKRLWFFISCLIQGQ